MVLATSTFKHELFGHSYNLEMAQNAGSQNDVNSLQQ